MERRAGARVPVDAGDVRGGLRYRAVMTRLRLHSQSPTALLVSALTVVVTSCTDGFDGEAAGGTSNASASDVTVPDPHFFGVFHDESVPVGYSNQDLPKDVAYLHQWQTLTLREDGVLHVEVDYCHGLLATHDYSWTFNPETQALEVLPTKGDLIEGYFDDYSKVIMTVEPECGVLTVFYVREGDGVAIPVNYYPGRVCAEGPDLDACRFNIVWCDEDDGPTCPEALPG